MRCGQGIHKACTHGLHVKRGHARHAQFLLYDTGGGWEGFVRGGGGHDDQIDVVFVQARAVYGLQCGLYGQIAGQFVFSSHMAVAYACARDDPFIRSVYFLRQIIIADTVGRQIAARA